jgi:hypothetical protein
MTYENLSTLPQWLSDSMCRLATGGGLTVRKNYTDLEEVHLDAQRPQVLNSIVELAIQGDLLDRSIILHLPYIVTTSLFPASIRS